MEKFVKYKEKHEIFKINYWTMCRSIEYDMEIGDLRRENKINDKEMIDLIREKYNIEQVYECIYTDGSKTYTGTAIGAGIYTKKTKKHSELV